MANLFLAICIISLSAAASAARGMSANCDTFSLYNCLPYVTDDKYLTLLDPGADCCHDVSTILDNRPQCFCEALNEVMLYGVALNETKGVGLPSACSLPGPKVGVCFDSPAPAVAPWSPTEAPMSPPTGNSPSAAPPSPPVPSAPSAPPSLSPAPSSQEPVPSPATGSLPVTAPAQEIPAPAFAPGSPTPASGPEIPVPAFAPGSPAPSFAPGSPAPAPGPENPAPAFAPGSPAPAPSGAQGLQSSLAIVVVTMAVTASSFVF